MKSTFLPGILLSVGSLLLASCANHPPCAKPYDPRLANRISGYFMGVKDARLPYGCWPVKHPKAVVIFANGWDSVSRDYDHLAEVLVEHGYAVYSPEMRCGIDDPDPQRRGAAPGQWQDWVEDLKCFTAFVRGKNPGVPYFYHAHSMGVMVCFNVIADDVKEHRELPKGIVAHSPPYCLMDDQNHPILYGFMNLVGGSRIHHLRYDPDRNGPTGDPSYNCVWGWSEDRVHRGYQLRYFREAMKMGRQARLRCRDLKLPMLALAGGDDHVGVFNDAQRKEYLAWITKEPGGGPVKAGGHCEALVFPHGSHTLTEGEQPGNTSRQARHDIAAWLDAHCR